MPRDQRNGVVFCPILHLAEAADPTFPFRSISSSMKVASLGARKEACHGSRIFKASSCACQPSALRPPGTWTPCLLSMRCFLRYLDYPLASIDFNRTLEMLPSTGPRMLGPRGRGALGVWSFNRNAQIPKLDSEAAVSCRRMCHDVDRRHCA